MIDREAIEVALFTKLQDALFPEFLETIGRKHIMPPTLQPEQQPALFSNCVTESKAPGPRGLPGKLTLHFLLFVYFYDDAPDETPGKETSLPATKANELKSAIEAALEPDPSTGVQTLGDLVSHCWIEGETPQDPCIFGKQGFLVVPVKVLVP